MVYATRIVTGRKRRKEFRGPVTLQALIHSLTQSCDASGFYGKPVERTKEIGLEVISVEGNNEVGLEVISLVRSPGFQ